MSFDVLSDVNWLAVVLTRQRPGAWFWINGGYQVVGLILAAVIVTVWD